MKLIEALKNIEKNKAGELFFSDILDYVRSIKSGENEVFDLATLDLLSEFIEQTEKHLEDMQKKCYKAVNELENAEVKNASNSKGKRGPSSKGTSKKTRPRNK